MKVVGIGVDLLQLSRIEGLVARRGFLRFAKRILSQHEQEALACLHQKHRQISFLASRFAAKEALFKATSSYRRLRWDEVSIFKAEDGKPVVKMTDETIHAHISLSHDGGFLVAFAQVYLQHSREPA